MAMPHVTGWIADRFNRGEVGGMQAEVGGEEIIANRPGSQDGNSRRGSPIQTAKSDDGTEPEKEHRH